MEYSVGNLLMWDADGSLYFVRMIVSPADVRVVPVTRPHIPPFTANLAGMSLVVDKIGDEPPHPFFDLPCSIKL